MTDGSASLKIRNARLRGRDAAADLLLANGRIVEVGQVSAGAESELDAEGGLVLPAFVDPHVHLDKSLLGEKMPPNESGTLPEAIEITNQFKRNYQPEEVASRAVRVLREAERNGTLAVRVFTDVGTIGGLVPFEGLVRAREQIGDDMHIQLVAFPQEGLIRDPGAEELMDEALKMGADIVGGLPWYEYTDADAREHIDICFRLAEKYDRDIHMLVDDTDDPNSRSLESLAVRTIRSNHGGRVSASHCGALAAYDNTYAAKVIDMVATAGITIVSNAQISLMISGRHDSEPIRRGVTRVRELLAAGVNVASGQDDVNDPYYPFGKPDQLEVAFIMSHAVHFSQPDELETLIDMVTGNAAVAMGLSDYGVDPGCQADLVVLNESTSHEALRMRSPRRAVIRNGQLVATDRG